MWIISPSLFPKKQIRTCSFNNKYVSAKEKLPCLCVLARNHLEFMETFHISQKCCNLTDADTYISLSVYFLFVSIFTKWGENIADIRLKGCIVWALGWHRRRPCVARSYEAWSLPQPLTGNAVACLQEGVSMETKAGEGMNRKRSRGSAGEDGGVGGGDRRTRSTH